tara:strand:+ start:19757 stop:21526 length:1770 start_codon:yes stop_codon:yes gene_type:complete
MAINPESQYPGKIAPATNEYPYGAARNITTPGDGTGTPWEAALVNDDFGFKQAILSESGIVPSGSPDKVGESQYLDGLMGLVSDAVEGPTGVKAYPAAPYLSASTSAPNNSAPAGTNALRDATTNTVYVTLDSNLDVATVSGTISALDFPAKTATVGGVSVTLERKLSDTATVKPTGANARRSLADLAADVAVAENYASPGDTDDTNAIAACIAANGYALLTKQSYTIANDIPGRCVAFGVPTVSGGKLDINDISVEYAHPGGRDTVRYKAAQEVTISANEMVMGGFRFLGAYKNRSARVFKTPATDNAVSLISNLGAETTKAINNWYAVFAVANEGDFECSFVLMPYLHLGSAISPGRFRTLEGGDNTYNPDDTADLKSYDWGVGVDGSDCLIITENGAFSGRVTTITGGGTTPGSNSITIADAGSVAKNDWILPAPKNFDFYRYCGSFFHDTAEVRNIADTGYYIGSRGVEMQELPDKGYDTGNQTNVELNPLGNICPLACGIRFVSVSSFATASTGSYSESFATDSSLHVVDQFQTHKTSGSTEAIGTHGIEVPFSFKPSFFFSNSGTIATSRSLGQMLPWGWYER